MGHGYDWTIRRTWLPVLVASVLAGCGDDETTFPSACTEEPGAIERALRTAPRAVRLGGTPISACVREASEASELQATGNGLVTAAGALADDAARDPGGEAELRLGYLVGAARRGAGDQGGERTELVRRLEQEALALEGDRSAYRRGAEAGERSG
jgi:hypothetical protein